jgi:hypothetical protein
LTYQIGTTLIPAAVNADKALHCPICRTGSRNRQGIVSHLRQVHGLDKTARDSAMAAAGI